MAKQETIKKIIDFFKDNEDVFNDCIEDLDSYNGYLGDDRCYSMDELDEFYRDTDPTEILTRAFYGRDNESWETDAHGNKIYGAFNPNRNYFYYNGYGNLVSCDYKDYSDKLDDYFVEQLAEHRQDIYAIEEDEELAELFDELEQDEE